MSLRWTLAAVAALGLMLACQQASWRQDPTTNKPRKNVVVQFTDATLHPEIARVTSGGNVVWVNYSAAGLDGSVVFPASIRESFTCDELRPLFMKVAAGYQSIPIQGESENVTLPCPLKTGEYEYQLYLFSSGTLSGGGQGAGASMDNPQSTMKGKIVVE
jgi:plastocyanin